MTPHLPALAEEIIATIAAEVPAYAQPMEGRFGAAMRLGVEAALARFGELIRTGGVGEAVAGDVYRELGRGEVRQGRSLEALLAAYRVGARVAWRRVAAVGHARSVGRRSIMRACPRASTSSSLMVVRRRCAADLERSSPSLYSSTVGFG